MSSQIAVGAVEPASARAARRARRMSFLGAADGACICPIVSDTRCQLFAARRPDTEVVLSSQRPAGRKTRCYAGDMLRCRSFSRWMKSSMPARHTPDPQSLAEKYDAWYEKKLSRNERLAPWHLQAI